MSRASVIPASMSRLLLLLLLVFLAALAGTSASASASTAEEADAVPPTHTGTNAAASRKLKGILDDVQRSYDRAVATARKETCDRCRLDYCYDECGDD